MSDPSIPRIRPGDIDATTPIVDARRHPGGHQIRGAVQYDPKHLLAADRLTLPLPHDRPVAIYADTDATAGEIATHLRSNGYAGAAVLDGGFQGWRDAELPIEETTQEQPIPGESGTGVARF